MGQSPTAPSSSSSPEASNYGHSTSTSSSTVTGLNLVRRSPQYRDGVEEGAGRVEQFVIIGTDISIARYVNASVLYSIVLYCVGLTARLPCLFLFLLFLRNQ